MADSQVDPDDFMVLIAHHTPRVRAFIATLVGFDAETIDEAMQATMLVAWKKLSTFRYRDEEPGEELMRWVCTIARFEVLGLLRDRKRRRVVAFDASLVEEIAEVQEEEASLLSDRRDALRSCVKRLDAKQVESLRLRYGIGLSMSEIAARQNRSVKAAVVAMCRLRQALEKCIRQTLITESGEECA